jgi:hypothetical protein
MTEGHGATRHISGAMEDEKGVGEKGSMSSDYLADIQRYDRHADSDTVQKIVRHIGLALKSRDGALVSFADAAQQADIRDNWCMRKLGESDGARCDEAIAAVRAAMDGDTAKQRVTFYYLIARQLDRLDAL